MTFSRRLSLIGPVTSLSKDVIRIKLSQVLKINLHFYLWFCGRFIKSIEMIAITRRTIES